MPRIASVAVGQEVPAGAKMLVAAAALEPAVATSTLEIRDNEACFME